MKILRLTATLFGAILSLGIPISSHSFEGLLNCGDPALDRGDYCFNDGSEIGGSVCQSFVGGCPEGEICLDRVVCPIPECTTPGLDLDEQCTDESGWICPSSSYDPDTGYCTIDPFGGKLTSGTLPTPACNDPSLAVGTSCRNDDGNLCSSTELGGAENCLVIYSCSGPDQIVQSCIASPTPWNPDPLLKRATDAAVQNVLEMHELPFNDEPLVRRHARDSLRAHLFTELLEIAKTPDVDREADEEAVIQAYEEQILELRERQARAAEQEYYKYARDPCSYIPPEGFIFERPTDCATPFGALFGTPAHPSLEEFEAYGVWKITKQDVLDDPEAFRLSQQTSRALILYVSVAVAGLIAVGVFVWLSLSVSFVATSIVTAIFPYGIFGTSLVAGAAAPVFFALLAIIGSVIAVIQYTEYEQFVTDVTSLVDEAKTTTINLREEVETERGQRDFYHVFIKSTQPEFDAPTPPAPTYDDPVFVLHNEAGNVLDTVPSIDLAVSNPDAPDSAPSADAISVRLHGGWFAPTRTTVSEGLPLEESRLSLSLDYIGWDGKPAVIWRKGTQFLIPGDATDGTSSDSKEPSSASDLISEARETNVLKFIDADGSKRQVIVREVESLPVITPVLTGQILNDSGWYVSTVDLSWIVEDPESEITSTRGCNPRTFSTDGEFVESCGATSADGRSAKVVIIRRDTKPPSISHHASPPANANGWNNTDVVVNYTCEDPSPGSGVASCPVVVTTLTQEGMHLVPPKTTSDVAGNSQLAGSLGVSIDKTSPKVSIRVPNDGDIYAVGQPVTARWRAFDGLSGIASASASSTRGSQVNTTTVGEFQFTVDASDRADNTTQVTNSYSVITREEAEHRGIDLTDPGVNTPRR